MKIQLISLLLVLVSFSGFSQTLEELDSIWKSVLAKEKAGLMMHSEDYELLRMVKNRTTTPNDIPYPQMTILTDSMKMRIDFIQEHRRTLASKRDRIIELAGGKSNFKKKDEAVELFNQIKTEFAGNSGQFDTMNAEVSQFHTQFGNLIMLYGIDIVTYEEYFNTFLKQLEDMEDQLVANASILGKRKQELEMAQAQKTDTALIEELTAKVADLTEIQVLSENKIVQIQNFQDRLGATTAEHEIYLGPGIELPYEIKIMREEMAKLVEHYKIFRIFNEDW